MISAWLRTARRVVGREPRPTMTARFRNRAFLRLEQLEGRAIPASFTVSNLDNDGENSLRWAIQQANESMDPASTITFAMGLSGTLSLATELPWLAKDIEIVGPEHDTITVRRSATATAYFGIFNISVFRTCRIRNLAMAYGDVGGSIGGAIYNNGTLYLSGVSLHHNRAEHGGAIYNTSTGTLELADFHISNNSATADGGGIYNDGRLTIRVVGTIGFNGAANGGGIYNTERGRLSIEDRDTSIDGNTATFTGGGIFNAGTLFMTGGSLAGNTAYERGGGLYNAGTGAVATLTEVAIEGNYTRRGGGVYLDSGTVTLGDCILSNNTATVVGPGVAWRTGSTLIIFGGTIFDAIERDDD